MKDNVPIEIRLYYRDDENNKVTVGTASYIYYLENGYVKHFNDVQLDIPYVKQTDPWAGKNIGVQLISTLTLADLDPDTGRAGGYWTWIMFDSRSRRLKLKILPTMRTAP